MPTIIPARTDDTPQAYRIHTRGFEEVVSAFGESLHCQSVHGCSRPAMLLATWHEPCGHQLAVCTGHHKRWMQEVLEAIAYWGYVRCHDCGQRFLTAEQCTRFRPI